MGSHARPATPSRNPSSAPSLHSQPSIDRFRIGRRGVGSDTMPTPSQSQTNLALPETDLNTIPDPRSPSPNPVSRQSSNNSMRHPDLSNEVATLSTKLINAINHQTNLDDQLQSTRHELEAAREKIAQLEATAREHESMVERGVLVQRSDSERIQNGLRSRIDDEHKARSEAEKEKKTMELELETLTSALFEEANGMVATARQEKEQSDRKGDQLKAKLDETQALLASHQEQLRDLKAVMQQLQSGGDVAPASTAPSTPVLASAASAERAPKASEHLEQLRAGTPTQVSFPEAPMSYANLIQPVVRTDLASYDDFLSLLRTTQSPSSRATSGTFSGLNVLGIGGRDSVQSTISVTAPQGPSNSSEPSNSPNIPGSFNGDPASPTITTNLKDTKFYKRALVEDIEPTLRLDAAPGLSWLARRTVLNAMLTGNLIIEPFPQAHRFYTSAFSCSMCGEVRKEYDYIRRHRFKTSDSEDAQTYPLCDYCLARVRATCDYMGFMRLAKKGHYRNESVGECKYAWEESVRLRERMFWSRVGGGVVPANVGLTTMPQSPTFAADSGAEEGRTSRGAFSDDAIRPGRTLGGFRKRTSDTHNSINGVNGVQLGRQMSLPDNTPASGSKLNPARASLPAGSPRPVSPNEPPATIDEMDLALPASGSVRSRELPDEGNLPGELPKELQKEEEVDRQIYADMAPSPAATPDLPAVTEAEANQAMAHSAGEVDSPQLKPALPGPTGSLRQFPRTRKTNSPQRSHDESVSSAPTGPTASTASAAPKMSKVASMAAKFQQDGAVPSEGRRAGASPARSAVAARSPSRPRSQHKDSQPQAQFPGMFG
ncbi:hypothetical protein FH972_024229 [Carpinus fangiana]|uniref:GDP/GTP exchange factor Sec2 N-terminal domain-containing protein n=1 Tax=Carpinus fangiana TaxID=176857 RepID=A0A5N6KYA0_9ROSI|nr:hypothetical protein FH972_024229 [Carpinus fangiana]